METPDSRCGAFCAALAEHPELELHGLVALRGGATVLEHSHRPYRREDRALVYSVSKTFTATAVGLAVGEGQLKLSDRVADLLAESAPAPLDPRVSELTVHHLLSMSTGHTEDTLPGITEAPPQEWVARFLGLPPPAPVGSLHVYNNGASFLLGELVRRSTGADLLEYLGPRVLAPLGIDATWDRDGLGRCLGWSGLHADVRALAAIGELYRCDGVWQGTRLLPAGWVARATAKQVDTDGSDPEWRFGYGYQLWLSREGYRLDGAYGQFSFVLPERELVIAVTSAQSCTQVLIDLIWDVLVPDLARTPPGPDARLGGSAPEAAELPIPIDSGRGAVWTTTGAVGPDPRLQVAGEEPSAPADLADVSARRDEGLLRLTLVAEGRPVELAAVPSRWSRQVMVLGDAEVPVAVAAGADPSGDLHVRLVFTDTPHTLRLRLGADGGAGQAWKVAPLQGPALARMRAH